MNVLDGTQSHSTQAPPMPSQSTTVTWVEFGSARGGDQCRLVAGGPAADDHDAGCHGAQPTPSEPLIAAATERSL